MAQQADFNAIYEEMRREMTRDYFEETPFFRAIREARERQLAMELPRTQWVRVDEAVPEDRMYMVAPADMEWRTQAVNLTQFPATIARYNEEERFPNVKLARERREQAEREAREQREQVRRNELQQQELMATTELERFATWRQAERTLQQQLNQRNGRGLTLARLEEAQRRFEQRSQLNMANGSEDIVEAGHRDRELQVDIYLTANEMMEAADAAL